MVNTAQQVGGSVGTALLSTLAATAVTSYAGGGARTPQVMAEASMHGYTTAFWWSAGIFLLGAIACGTLLRSGAAQQAPAGEPAFAH
jgi:hypothetical protein